MDDLVARLLTAISEAERAARGHRQASGEWHVRGGEVCDVLNTGTVAFVPRTEDAEHVALHDPDNVLRRCAADRELIAEVQSWEHDYNAEDPHCSCAQAVVPEYLRSSYPAFAADEAKPGGGCYDEARTGKRCDCATGARRERVLKALAKGYGLTVEVHRG